MTAWDTVGWKKEREEVAHEVQIPVIGQCFYSAVAGLLGAMVQLPFSRKFLTSEELSYPKMSGGLYPIPGWGLAPDLDWQYEGNLRLAHSVLFLRQSSPKDQAETGLQRKPLPCWAVSSVLSGFPRSLTGFLHKSFLPSFCFQWTRCVWATVIY